MYIDMRFVLALADDETPQGFRTSEARLRTLLYLQASSASAGQQPCNAEVKAEPLKRLTALNSIV